jgi:acyl dehydratase
MPQRKILNIDQLRALAGQEVGVSEWLTVSQDLIDQFAAVAGDTQWIHVDPARARSESPFGATVAHGILTLSLMSRLVRDAVQVEGKFKMDVTYGLNRVRFPAAVISGARIRAHVVPHAINDFAEGVEIVWNVTLEMEGSVKPALAAEWVVRKYS